MSWGGHVADMIAKMRYNESLKSNYRNRHERIRNAFRVAYKEQNIHWEMNRVVTKEEMIRIKAEVRKTIAREKVLHLVKTWSLTLIVFVILLYLLFKYLIPGILSHY